MAEGVFAMSAVTAQHYQEPDLRDQVALGVLPDVPASDDGSGVSSTVWRRT